MKRVATFVLLTAVLALSAACASPTQVHKVQLTVYIQRDGTILIDGKPGRIEDLKRQLQLVKQNDGAVAYSRANPTGDPPPNAMEVLKTIIDAKVPVQMPSAPNGTRHQE